VATAAVLYVTDRADVQSIGCRLSPHIWACSLCSQIAACTALVCHLMVSTTVIHVIYMDYYSFTYRGTQKDGRLSWPGWLTNSGHLTNPASLTSF